MIKIGLAGAPPILSAGLRFMIASIFLLAIILFKRITLPRTRKFIVLSIFLGFFQMGIPYALVYWGEQYITSGLTSILFSTMPLAVALLARLMLGDPLGFNKVAGILVGLAGVLVIFSDNLHMGGSTALVGMAAVVLSAVLASLSTVVVKKYSFQYNPIASIFPPITIGGMLLTLTGLAAERSHPMNIDGMTVFSIVYLGLIGTVCAFGLYYWIIKHIDVTLLSYQTFIIPILASLIGWIFLREIITLRMLIGSSLIFGGIALEMRKKNGERAPRDA